MEKRKKNFVVNSSIVVVLFVLLISLFGLNLFLESDDFMPFIFAIAIFQILIYLLVVWKENNFGKIQYKVSFIFTYIYLISFFTAVFYLIFGGSDLGTAIFAIYMVLPIGLLIMLISWIIMFVGFMKKKGSL